MSLLIWTPAFAGVSGDWVLLGMRHTPLQSQKLPVWHRLRCSTLPGSCGEPVRDCGCEVFSLNLPHRQMDQPGFCPVWKPSGTGSL